MVASKITQIMVLNMEKLERAFSITTNVAISLPTMITQA